MAPGWAADQRTLLIQRRRALSHELMHKVQGSYLTRDTAGRQLDVLTAYRSLLEGPCHSDERSNGEALSATSEGSERERPHNAPEWFPAGTHRWL